MRRASAGVALALVLAAGGVIAHPGTGPLLRRVAVGPAPAALVLDAPAGRLYVADRVDGVLRVIATTGALVRRLALGRGGPLAVDARSGRLFVADAWNGPDRNGVYRDHAVIRVLDGRSGAPVRTVALGVDEDILALLADGAGTRTGMGGRVLAVCADVALVVDARSGTVIQRIPAGGRAYGALAALDLARRRALVLTSDAQALDVLDLRRGRLVRMVEVGGYLTGLAVDRRAGRVVVIDAGQGMVRLLDADTLRRVASVALGSAPTALAVDERTGRILIAAGAAVDGRGPSRVGRVLVLDGRTGAVRRTMSVSGTPVLVAVDPRTEHVFVGVDDPGATSPGFWEGLPDWLRRWVPWARPSAAPRATRERASVQTMALAG